MGKELPLARSEEEGQSELLANTGIREFIEASSSRDQRTQEPTTSKVSKRRKVKDTKAKSKSRRKTKGTHARYSESARRRRDNKDRKSDRGDEGEDKSVRRSAQELGVTHPGSYCNELETVPHYWYEVDIVGIGAVFQCRFCHKHLWLPMFQLDAEKLSKLIRKYGEDEGYCHYLNRYRAAKVLMAKLQDLRRLEMEITDKREFARLTDKILSDKEYDRKEVR